MNNPLAVSSQSLAPLSAEPAIRLIRRRIFHGASIYASVPVITVALDLPREVLRDAGAKIANVTTAFSRWFSWAPPSASLDEAAVGDFLVSLARAMLSEVRGTITVGYSAREDKELILVLGYFDEQLSLEALQIAANLFLAIDKISPAQRDERLAVFWDRCQRLHPNRPAQFFIDYCQSHDIPYRQLLAHNCYFWQFGAGVRSLTFDVSSPITDNFTWAQNKAHAKELFASVGAPTVESIVITHESQLAAAIRKIGTPCVVKPLAGNNGKGVTTCLRDLPAVVEAYRHAQEVFPGAVLLERHVEGEINRVFVVRGKFWKAIRRDRPTVVGDGASTVATLLERYNAPLEAHVRPNGLLGTVPTDSHYLASLRSQGLTPGDVPAKGRVVIVRNVATAENGSRYADVTEQVHPDTVLMSESLARYFGIDVCGLDLITEDISRSCFEQGAFIEINCAPGLMTPQRVGVSKEEVARVILGDVPARIPVVLVIADQKHHEALWQAIPREEGIGWVCGDRSGIGATELARDFKPGYLLVDRIIRNKLVVAMAIICDPASLKMDGLPVDKAELAVWYGDRLMDAPWRDVVTRHSMAVQAVSRPDALADLLRKHLTA